MIKFIKKLLKHKSSEHLPKQIAELEAHLAAPTSVPEQLNIALPYYSYNYITLPGGLNIINSNSDQNGKIPIYMHTSGTWLSEEAIIENHRKKLIKELLNG